MSSVARVAERSGIRTWLYVVVHSGLSTLRGEDIAVSVWLKGYRARVFYPANCIYGIMRCHVCVCGSKGKRF